MAESTAYPARDPGPYRCSIERAGPLPVVDYYYYYYYYYYYQSYCGTATFRCTQLTWST